ncbi:MAG: hypothetical protein ACI9N1_002071 [Flavobacteriales bacterium]|jgi:hypothetical protein
MKINFSILISLIFLSSCGSAESTSSDNSDNNLPIYSSEVKTLTDVEYPDNNDIESRCADWQDYKHNTVNVVRGGVHDFTLTFLPSSENSDTLIIDHVDLLSWIPTIPSHIKDPYLQHIGIINAEWNRHQVKLSESEYHFAGNHKEKNNTVRIDLARNCLNAHAWELITYTKVEGEKQAMYHGWFDFPHDLYNDLFDEVNKGVLVYADYINYLESYTDPESQLVNLDELRIVNSEKEVDFTNLNDQFYPKTGARKSKFKNIVYPNNPKVINDFLTDSTKFSTFQWPGFYDTSDPRSTTLSKVGIPEKVMVRQINSKNSSADACLEFEIQFASNKDSSIKTSYLIGGVKKDMIPILALEDYNGGFKYPMGIGNHAFYESYEVAIANDVKNSTYYAFVLDGQGKWLDSHFFGVDGPLLHFDIENPKLLHFWMMSFERHAMVTHLTFEVE